MSDPQISAMVRKYVEAVVDLHPECDSGRLRDHLTALCQLAHADGMREGAASICARLTTENAIAKARAA